MSIAPQIIALCNTFVGTTDKFFCICPHSATNQLISKPFDSSVLVKMAFSKYTYLIPRNKSPNPNLSMCSCMQWFLKYKEVLFLAMLKRKRYNLHIAYYSKEADK